MQTISGVKAIQAIRTCDLDMYFSLMIGELDGDLDSDFLNGKTGENNAAIDFSLSANQNMYGNKIEDFICTPLTPSSLYKPKLEDMYVECGLYVNNSLICPKMKTSYKHQSKNIKGWKEWIVFPVKYSELPLNTVVCVTIIDTFLPRKPMTVASSTYSIFDTSTKLLRRGKHKCVLSPLVEPNTSTPSLNTIYNTTDLLTRIEMNLYGDHWSDEKSRWLINASLKAVNNMRREGLLSRKGIAFLDLEFVDFPEPVIFYEGEPQTGIHREIPLSTLNSFKQQNKLINTGEPLIKYFDTKGVQFLVDPEVQRGKENPSVTKHIKLTMKVSDNHLHYPDVDDKRKLENIVKKTPLQEITSEDTLLLWKYRKFLQGEKRIGEKALTKFLRVVDWRKEEEAREAISLLDGWTKIDTTDALFLLSKHFKGVDAVRNYAISVLKDVTDKELLSVLLQLVQALRYEHDMRTCKLADLLIERSQKSFIVANDLFWFLTIAAEDKIMGEFYSSLLRRFKEHCKTKCPQFVDQFLRQQKLVRNLSNICQTMKEGSRDQTKLLMLKAKFESIKNGEGGMEWNGVFDDSSALRLPLDPVVAVKTVDPSSVTIFSSNARPMRLSFITKDDKKYTTIFKIGDDLRQDQLVIQLIHKMDMILKDHGMDLKLTPYRVLACGSVEGFLECVTPSMPFEKIIKTNTIEGWLREENKHKSPQELNEVFDNFMKSCAGYCVITYILGVGDRHLDNILLTPDGRLFHIDFGWILGHDPKPYPPPMKLSADMILGMGGAHSDRYKNFIKLCCNAFNILRAHSRIILNLLILMVDANIPHIDYGIASNRTTGDQMTNILTVQQRLCLDVSEEEALQFMKGIISESEKAFFGKVHDHLHRWAQYWRN
ncbi:hypothetical protein C9374_008201 [Naegleria lovaniensis]|uniref:phosphatidylinositol 3-kinase n=1 Tax=Naegleria lovaniensis TaxID=51637 RepID=A0AA88GFM0_NAELO|nr:uncharacterized protein C9374_008201 [Naegleria lovaniensis]KAG2378562.1 hypothetical protein C9374_008201 [Naegleria lovaniensis]